MNVYRSRLNKEKLLQIPELERKLFITIAHLQNEIRFSLYGAVWSADYSSDNEAIVHGQISLNFFYSKILAGKLYEGWKLLQTHYCGNKPLSLDFNANGSKEAISILKELGKYFGRKNAISHVGRNKLVRALARTGVSGKHHPNSPETPPLATRLVALFRPTPDSQQKAVPDLG